MNDPSAKDVRQMRFHERALVAGIVLMPLSVLFAAISIVFFGGQLVVIGIAATGLIAGMIMTTTTSVAIAGDLKTEAARLTVQTDELPSVLCEAFSDAAAAIRSTFKFVAIYETHLVNGRIRTGTRVPAEAHEPGGHQVWSSIPGVRNVASISLARIDGIHTRDVDFPERRTTVRVRGNAVDWKIKLSRPDGEHLKLRLLQLDVPLYTQADSERITRRKRMWACAAACMMIDIGGLYLVWEMISTGTLPSLPSILSLLHIIHEQNGFGPTTLTIAVFCVFVNAMVLCLSLVAPVRPPGLLIKSAVNCSQCGYDLRGNTGARCPECGTGLE